MRGDTRHAKPQIYRISTTRLRETTMRKEDRARGGGAAIEILSKDSKHIKLLQSHVCERVILYCVYCYYLSGLLLLFLLSPSSSNNNNIRGEKKKKAILIDQRRRRRRYYLPTWCGSRSTTTSTTKLVIM